MKLCPLCGSPVRIAARRPTCEQAGRLDSLVPSLPGVMLTVAVVSMAAAIAIPNSVGCAPRSRAEERSARRREIEEARRAEVGRTR